MNKALAKKEEQTSLKNYLETNFQRIKEVAVNEDVAKATMRLSLVAANGQPEIYSATPASVLKCVMEMAAIGLMPGPLKHAHIVVFKGKAVLIPGYQGFIALAHDTGSVTSWVAEAIYEGDEFEVVLGTDRKILHKPNLEVDREDEKKITHVYSVVTLRDGTQDFDWLTRKQIEKVMKNTFGYKSGKSTPWTTHFGEMAKKTVIKHHSKRIPMHERFANAVDLDNARDRNSDFSIITPDMLPDGDEKGAKEAEAKTKSDELAEKLGDVVQHRSQAEGDALPKKRGRPKGSGNKPKNPAEQPKQQAPEPVEPPETEKPTTDTKKTSEAPSDGSKSEKELLAGRVLAHPDASPSFITDILIDTFSYQNTDPDALLEEISHGKLHEILSKGDLEYVLKSLSEGDKE